MAFRPLLWVGVLTLTVPPVLRGQDSVPVLRLGELYRALPAASPRIAAATALARAADQRVAPTRRPPDPQVQVGWMNRSLPGLERSDPLGMDQIQVMQMLPVAGQLGLAGRAASERAVAEHARATDVEWEVRARVAMAYYDLYRMDRSLIIAHETLRLLQDLLKQAESMYSVGEGRQADVLRAQVEIARMTEEIVRMEADRLGAAARLNALFARSSDQLIGTPMLPRFPAALPPLDSLIADADARRPMVQVAQANVRAADADAQRARREIWPDLQVGMQYAQRPMADGSTDRMVSLMLGASIPIFAGSRQLAMRRETEAMRAMAGAELTEMRADTRGRVGELHAVVERARRLGDLYRTTILPQADATVLSARAAYRVGAVDFMTVLDDQMTVNRYRLDLIALDAERGGSLAELEMLLGRELFDPSAPADTGAPR